VVDVNLPQESWKAILATPEAEEYFEATITFDGLKIEKIAFRTKGNSSLNSLKKSGSHRFSFKLDVNYYLPDQELLGEKKVVFNNGFKDPSLIREHLAYGLARDFGIPAPRTAFVDLTVAGEHLGLYTMVETVDGGFLKSHFSDPDGDLYKPEPPAGNLTWGGTDPAKYGGLECKQNEDTTDHAAFIALVDTLNNQDPSKLAAVLDIEEALRYLALNVVLVNLDSYLGFGHNFYLYEQAGVFTVIPWDLNEAFGNFTCGCNRDGLIHLRIEDPNCSALAKKPLVARLLADKVNLVKYRDLLKELIDGPFSEKEMTARIKAAADLIRPHVEKDTTKFFTTADFESSLAQDIGWGASPVIGLVPFVKERSAAVLAQLDGKEPATNNGQGSCKQGTTNPCGDGVCDEFEKAHPQVCPKDCQTD
jgi:spore coat protein CotH